MKRLTVDIVDRLLKAKAKIDAFDRAIFVLTESKKEIRNACVTLRKRVGEPSYATNRMGCVDTEINAALRGLRWARGNARRALANTRTAARHAKDGES